MIAYLSLALVVCASLLVTLVVKLIQFHDAARQDTEYEAWIEDLLRSEDK